MSRPPAFEAAIAFAADLIRIPSPPGEERDVAERVVGEMELLGFDDVRADALGNVIGVVRGSVDGAPSVLVNSHLDVVDEGDPEEWEHPPFSGAVEGGFLHGRGAMDIKGPLALQTYAAATLRGRTPGDVVVAHTVFEERGGLGMQGLLEAGDLRPDVVILGEATHGDVCIGHRGRAEVEVVLTGRAGHASAPERARNALDCLPAVLEGVRDLAADQPTDPVLGAATLAATDVVTSPDSHNVIPDRVVVTLDWRILPGPGPEELLDRVREALAGRLPRGPADGNRTGAEGMLEAEGERGEEHRPQEEREAKSVLEAAGVRVRMAAEHQVTWTGVARNRDLHTPGFFLEPEHPVARAAAEAVGRRNGEGPATLRPWTFATDGGWSCGVHGIPTVGFAPGEERFAHTNRERLGLAEAEWAFGRYPKLVLAVMEAAR